MTTLQPFSSPPRWLPLHLLLGGIIAAGLVLLSHHHALSFTAPAPGLWARCASSFLVLAIGLLLALCIGLIIGLHARKLGPRIALFIAFLGRALACVPVVVLAWGFISGWIGHLGWPVESLMPAQFPDAQASPPLARILWEFLAPSLVLALSLCGEMIHAVITDGRDTFDLDFSLRARGIPTSSRIWRHHLSQLLPLLRVRLQSLCLIAPVYLIIIEDTLGFMGWGGWLAQSIRGAAAGGIALGFASGGTIMALLCASLHLLRGRLKSARSFVSTLAWQPWLLWALGALALLPTSFQPWLILWTAVLISSTAAWHQAWSHIEEELPIDASRVFGASEKIIWRTHIAPLQVRMLTAWLCAVFAQTLLGIAAACSLQHRLIEALSAPLAKLYRPLAIASMQDAAHTLADPTALLQSGGGIALAVLCLLQLSRIVQPRNL